MVEEGKRQVEDVEEINADVEVLIDDPDLQAFTQALIETVKQDQKAYDAQLSRSTRASKKILDETLATYNRHYQAWLDVFGALYGSKFAYELLPFVYSGAIQQKIKDEIKNSQREETHCLFAGEIIQAEGGTTIQGKNCLAVIKLDNSVDDKGLCLIRVGDSHKHIAIDSRYMFKADVDKDGNFYVEPNAERDYAYISFYGFKETEDGESFRFDVGGISVTIPAKQSNFALYYNCYSLSEEQTLLELTKYIQEKLSLEQNPERADLLAKLLLLGEDEKQEGKKDEETKPEVGDGDERDGEEEVAIPSEVATKDEEVAKAKKSSLGHKDVHLKLVGEGLHGEPYRQSMIKECWNSLSRGVLMAKGVRVTSSLQMGNASPRSFQFRLYAGLSLGRIKQLFFNSRAAAVINEELKRYLSQYTLTPKDKPLPKTVRLPELSVEGQESDEAGDKKRYFPKNQVIRILAHNGGFLETIRDASDFLQDLDTEIARLRQEDGKKLQRGLAFFYGYLLMESYDIYLMPGEKIRKPDQEVVKAVVGRINQKVEELNEQIENGELPGVTQAIARVEERRVSGSTPESALLQKMALTLMGINRAEYPNNVDEQGGAFLRPYRDIGIQAVVYQAIVKEARDLFRQLAIHELGRERFEELHEKASEFYGNTRSKDGEVAKSYGVEHLITEYRTIRDGHEQAKRDLALQKIQTLSEIIIPYSETRGTQGSLTSDAFEYELDANVQTFLRGNPELLEVCQDFRDVLGVVDRKGLMNSEISQELSQIREGLISLSQDHCCGEETTFSVEPEQIEPLKKRVHELARKCGIDLFSLDDKLVNINNDLSEGESVSIDIIEQKRENVAVASKPSRSAKTKQSRQRSKNQYETE